METRINIWWPIELPKRFNKCHARMFEANMIGGGGGGHFLFKCKKGHLNI